MLNHMSHMEEKENELFQEIFLRKLSGKIHAAPNVNEILTGFRSEILKLNKCELVTIYLTDRKRKSLYSKVKRCEQTLKEICVSLDKKSIAGFVAVTGRVLNIQDVSNKKELLLVDPDLRFDSSWDKKSGFRTKNMLSVPVRFKNQIIGVIQLINKCGSKTFSGNDERLLTEISETIAIAVSNLKKNTRKLPTKFDSLVSDGVISETELEDALISARERKTDPEDLLIETYNVSRSSIGKSLSVFYQTPFIDLTKATFNPINLIKGTGIQYFHSSCWFPLKKKSGKVMVVIDDPHDSSRVQDINLKYGLGKVSLCVSVKSDILNFIQSYSLSVHKNSNTAPDESSHDSLDYKEENYGIYAEREKDHSDNSITILCHKIIEDAIRMEVSDVHIEPYGREKEAEIRFRVDGICREVLVIPQDLVRGLVSKFKIMSNLDISERRIPQDGKFRFPYIKGEEIEMRVVTIPTSGNNEDMVIRLLPSGDPAPLEELMPQVTYDRFSKVIRKPYGLILVVGPTGSGKTTTLHSAMRSINTPGKKIWTAEDPIEITQHRLRQVQILPKVGLTFESAMRAFLRADPDVIMVGEMRDKETMGTGIEASLTGHLVLSTLHTNSAPETILRLSEMGLDPYYFADALLGILAQRLVRTLCSNCKECYHPDHEEYRHLADTFGEGFNRIAGSGYGDEITLFRPTGCEKCDHTGYRGRMGLYELLVANDDIRNLIIKRELVGKIRDQGIKDGMMTLQQDGIRNVLLGHTDFIQVASVCER